MMRRIILSPLLVLVSSLAVVSQTQPQTPQVEEPPALSVPKTYRYSARGRRDPFVNPVPKPKVAAAPVAAPPAVRPPGLRGVLMVEAQVAGVVTSKEPSMNVVIIAAPGAKTPYFARVGDQLYDATVKNIGFETVTFTETGPPGENLKPREVVRQVRPKAGENK